jgi:hypothetical protein
MCGSGRAVHLDEPLVVGGDALGRRLPLERKVAQVLSDEGIQVPEIADFAEEELARLALKAGIDPRTLVLLRQSYALASDINSGVRVFKLDEEGPERGRRSN